MYYVSRTKKSNNKSVLPAVAQDTSFKRVLARTTNARTAKKMDIVSDFLSVIWSETTLK